MDLIDECTLLGAAILSAQKLEFSLYGIASHLSHTKAAQKEKRFRDLTPEKFLRGNVDELKATLGQLEETFGKTLLISSHELKKFIRDRNIIVHSYWRLTKCNVKGCQSLADPETFLRDFLARCDYWSSIVRGLLCVLMGWFAEKEGKTSEINLNKQDADDVAAYYVYLEKGVALGWHGIDAADPQNTGSG